MPKPHVELYESKPGAQAALGRLFDTNDPRIITGDTQFGPNQGYIAIVLVSPGVDFADLEAKGFEVQVHGAAIAAPSSTKAPKGTRAPSAPDGAVTAPTKGVTAQVWAIADTFLVEKGAVDRAAIIKLCEAAGIHPATAATQFSKWKRARGQ